MKKGLLTLIAGYAAGLAIAMKFRKDQGNSQLPQDGEKPTAEGFLNEVVDIHRAAFGEAKKFFDDHLDDVTDFDSLKMKVEKVVLGFIPEIEERIKAVTAQGEEKKQQVLDIIERSYGEKQAFLQNAQAKAERFVDSGSDTLKTWIDGITKQLDIAYEKLKNDTQA